MCLNSEADAKFYVFKVNFTAKSQMFRFFEKSSSERVEISLRDGEPFY